MISAVLNINKGVVKVKRFLFYMGDKKHGERTRKSYSIKENMSVIVFANNNPLFTQRQLSIKFKMSLGAINNIFRNKENIQQNSSNNLEKIRLSYKTKMIDSPLFEWFSLKRSKNLPVTDDILKLMALELGDKF